MVHLIDAKTGYAESEGATTNTNGSFSRPNWTRWRRWRDALYALRTNLAEPPPREAILDDFIISNVGRQGKRIIYDDEATAVEDAAPDMSSEFRRKVRVAMGAFQSLFCHWGIPGISTPWLTGATPHKVLRWLGPVLLLGCFISNTMLALENHLFLSLFILQCLFYSLATIGLISTKTRGARTIAVPMYFTMMNAAFALGLWRYFTRHRRKLKPTARTRLTGKEGLKQRPLKASGFQRQIKALKTAHRHTDMTSRFTQLLHSNTSCVA